MMRNLILPALLAAALPLTAQVVKEPAARTLKLTRCEVTCLAMAPKGDRILVGTDKGAELWDIEAGRRVHAFPFSEDGSTAVYHAAFNNNGELVVLIGHSGKREVWDVRSGKQDKMLHEHNWIPDPRAVKAMGLDLKNSTFDRFYQQLQAQDNGITATAVGQGGVEFHDASGKLLQKLQFPENKDPHHRAPCLFSGAQFITGTDDGRVLIYDRP